MSEDQKISINIQRCPDGGYLVADGYPLFASTTIDEALAYIKRVIEPEPK